MGNNDEEKFFYLLTGIGIGALVGVLFAPHSGKRIRRLITDQAAEGSEYLLRKGQDLCEQVSDSVERGKGLLADQRDHLVAAVAAGKQAYRAKPQSESNPNSK
jgi:gas vesicle protein